MKMMSCFPPPCIEQVFEADADGDDGGHGLRVHCLAHLWSKLSQAERIAAEKARRANPNVDASPEISVVGDVSSSLHVPWHDDFRGCPNSRD